MQGGKRQNKDQQAWHDWQRSQSCVNCDASNPAIHHCAGSTAKHNKIEIGQWFVIPLCYECHQGDQGIHHGMGRFEYYPDEWGRKEIEKDCFEQICISYSIDKTEYMPVPNEVYDAIMSYRR